MTINAPLAVGSSNQDILDAHRSKLIPQLKNFRPEFILISAGFDAYEADPLGGMVVTAEGFAKLIVHDHIQIPVPRAAPDG